MSAKGVDVKQKIMSYADKIKSEFKNYAKQKGIPIGKWQNKGRNRPHILCEDYKHKNLIGNYGEKFWQEEKDKIKLHRYFHHLNSSQAMCINFFYPLIQKKKLDVILQKLGLDSEEVSYDSVGFEKESEKDDKKAISKNIPELKQKQVIPTSFDFYLETKSGKKLYFEIKYTESEFGGAQKEKDSKEYEQKYKLKYERIYKKAANGKIASTFNNKDFFLDNYQIMRNLIHVSNDSFVVFVIPKGNVKVYEKAKKAKDYVDEKYKKNVMVLTWNELSKIDFEEDLKEYYQEFWDKYKL